MYTSQDKLTWFKSKLDQGCIFCAVCGKEINEEVNCSHVPRCYAVCSSIYDVKGCSTTSAKLWIDNIFTQVVGEELLMYPDEEILSLPLFDKLIVKETIASSTYWFPISKYKASNKGYIGSRSFNFNRVCS